MFEIQTKTKILEICRDLIQVKNYHSFTINEIADVLKISTSTIYHHFKNKENLVKETIIKYKNDFSEMLREIEQQENCLRKSLTRFVELYASVLEPDNQKICLCMTLMIEINTLPTSLIEELNHFFDLQCDWIIKIFQKYETTAISDDDAAMLISSLEGMITVARLKGGSDYFKKVAYNLINNFLLSRSNK